MSKEKALRDGALWGLSGEIVSMIEPHSEADPLALLIQFLTAFGNIVGRRSFYQVERDRHYPNLFVNLVGTSSKARKGTSWGQIKNGIISEVDPLWLNNNISSGLSSGEGLSYALRDKDADKGTFNFKEKRLLIIESEFSSVLKNLKRTGNTLSPVLRDAWDKGSFKVMTRNNPYEAKNGHISTLGHITINELKKDLNETEAANGFGNRFLWLLVKRSKLLPSGGDIESVDFSKQIVELKKTVAFGQKEQRLILADKSNALWENIYYELAEEKSGIYGSLTARSEPQVLRLALIFALLDSSPLILPPHLKAAKCIWDLCDLTCKKLFKDSLGDKDLDKLMDAIENNKEGLSRSYILKEVFKRNKKSEELDVLLYGLMKRGLIMQKVNSGKTEVWVKRPNDLTTTNNDDE